MVVDVHSRPDGADSFWRRAWPPLAVAVGVHVLIVVVYFSSFGLNPSCFVNVGYAFRWANEEHFAPGTIKFTRLAGYDGCDYYIVALDPLMLRDDVAPTYKRSGRFLRYQRTVYPLLVHLLSGGKREYFPHAMLAINFAAMIGVAILLMKLLLRRNASPWLSLVFVLGAGALLGFSLALQMYLCFLFVVAGLYLYDRERKAASALCFAVAIMTWETALLFAAPIGLWELLHRKWKGVICFLLVPVPSLLVRAYFAHRLGAHVLGGSPVALSAPFVGLWQAASEILSQGAAGGGIKFLRKLLILPAMAIFVAMFLLACWKGARRRGGLFDLMLGLQALFVLVEAKDIWITFSNVMRVNAGIFIPLILSYRDQRERVSPWLWAWAGGLSACALVRILMNVVEPYVLIGR